MDSSSSYSFPLESDKNQLSLAFIKGPKRKRLAKACDACHKSKRRCDGTAPCSNCYFASKSCTYTDASGRAVPAPMPLRRDPPPHSPSSSHISPDSEDKAVNPRKRFRPDTADHTQTDSPIAADRPTALDNALTRELVSLFFTHCHPQRIIIHKPSFSSALTHSRVPSYLLHAVCALAAPLSKQPRIRTSPIRSAGKPFAQAALALMFDDAGCLICEPNLATAQALCLLHCHEGLGGLTVPTSVARYLDLASHILEDLGVHKPDNPMLTPLPSPEFIQTSIERECVRRMFWLIHFEDLMGFLYLKIQVPPKDNELLLRLPVDETSFELAVHSTLPEYLHLPAPRVQYASEFGHLIRVLSIHARVETLLDARVPVMSQLDSDPLLEAEQTLDAWATSLPDHLRFSEESLQVQLSMFETSSNMGAWCFCCTHVVHASCALALNFARQGQPPWAVARLEMILSTLGSRARNSVIMGSALWSLVKYCHRDDQQIHAWAAEFEQFWGVDVLDLVRDAKRHHVPSQWRSAPRGFYAGAHSPSPSLGPSLDELRINGRAYHGDLGDESMRDADIDPALQGAPRGDAQSLPSLKASGLLDSWNPGQDVAGAWAHKQGARRSPGAEAEAGVRAGKAGMPVGMPWLANEQTNRDR